MLSVNLDTIRLFLHIIAATIWVGGQLVLLGLLSTVRQLGEDAPKKVARAYNRLAWPAFAVLVATGIWNLFEVNLLDTTTQYQVTVFVKLAVVAMTGVGAFIHSTTADRRMLAITGSLAGVGALGALFLGVMLRA